AAGTDISTPNVSGVLNANEIELFFVVNPNDGTVVGQYALDGGPRVTVGTITLTGSMLNAVRGTYTNQGQPSALAVGIIGTSFGAAPAFGGTWDYIAVD